MKNILKYSDKLLYILYFTVIISFYSMYIWITLYYKLAADDYSIISLIKQNGVLGTAFFTYFNWTGTIFLAAFVCTVLYIFQSGQLLFIYFIITVVILFFTIYFCLKYFFQLYQLEISKSKIFVISNFIIFFLFFTSFDLTQNWFWLDGSLAYIYPLIFLFTNISFYLKHLNSKKNNDLYISLFFGIIFGNSTLNYVVLFFIIIIVFSLLNFNFNFKNIFKTLFQNSRLILFFTSIFFGFLINIISPGNFVRKSVELKSNHMENINFFLELIKSQVWTFKYIFFQFKYIIVIIFPLVYLLKNNLVKTSEKKINGLLLNCFIVFICLSILNSIIMFLSLKTTIHSRTMLMLSIVEFLLFFLMILRIYIFLIKYFSSSIFYFTSISFVIILIYINIKTIIIQLPIIKTYSNAVEERLNKINSNIDSNPLELERLPNSGVLFTSEISNDTNNYINYDMKKALELKFTIKLKD
jgi:hypothetical protein